MKNVFFLLFIALSFSIVSCGGDDDGIENCNAASLNFAQEFSDEIQAIVDTGAAYGMDQSSSNCSAYKEAVRDYIDALRGFEDCAREAGALAEWNQALAEYDENEINNLC